MRLRLNWVLVGIVLVASVLRIVWITNYPSGFTPDEADLGYNGYSILKTGLDEWSTPWWKLFYTNLRSFGDYKLPLYSFLTIPSIAVFGLNEFAVRLPSALFGIGAVVGVYFLAKHLFPEYKQIGWIAAGVLAVSPWHIQLSRGAFEANLITFFLPWTLYFFLKRSYTVSLVLLAASFYSYHTARYLAPFLLIVLAWYTKFKPTRKLLAPLIIFVLLSLPALVAVVGSGRTRAADVSVLSPTDEWSGVADRRFEARNSGLPDQVARLFSNKLTQVISSVGRSYLDYLSPDFLFISGAGEATYGMIPGRGVMYAVEIIFMGAYVILLIKTKSRPLILLGLLLLICPIPAALAKSSGNAANRVAPMIPILSIMVSVGLIHLLSTLKKYRRAVTLTFAGAYLVGLAFFLEDYVYHAPKLNAPAMSFGWREGMDRLVGIAKDYDVVQVSRSLSEPQIFIAFYQKMDPAYFQSQSKAWVNFNATGLKFLDQYDGYTLGKYKIGNLDLDRSKKTLLVGKPDDIPDDYGQYFDIVYPDGKIAIKVSKTQND